MYYKLYNKLYTQLYTIYAVYMFYAYLSSMYDLSFDPKSYIFVKI